MKIKVLIVAAAITLFGFFWSVGPVFAQSSDTFSGKSLCVPGIYSETVSDCYVMGPSAFLSEMAAKGLTFPQRPVPAYRPDFSLGYADEPYLKVGEHSFPLYNSLEDALAKIPSTQIAAGMKYFAILERLDLDQGVFYHLVNGQWLNGGEADASCCTYSNRLQGLVFEHNPYNSFGWIVDQTKARVAPGYASPETDRVLYRKNVVQVYDVQEADGVKWYMIGFNEWIERRYIREFNLNLTPPEGVTNGRWIEVNLYEQTLGVYENGRLVYATLIASGMDPFFTQPGLFQIYKKYDKTNMSGAFEADRSDYYFLEDVPWTMYYDDARALHGAYWRTLYGYPQSHGCVNLSIGDAKFIYDWANEGDWVYVWDPSGETPMDAKYYSSGAAF